MIRHPNTDHDYITTISGINFPANPDNLLPEHIDLRDIVAGLSNMPRYQGQCRIGIVETIAEHSILVHHLAYAKGERDPDVLRAALLHDAHEAYTGDLASPQKRHVRGWRSFENRVEAVVREALGLGRRFVPKEVWKRIKEYDTMILHREIGPSSPLRVVPPDWYDPNIDAQVPNHIQVRALTPRLVARVFEENLRLCGFDVPESIG